MRETQCKHHRLHYRDSRYDFEHLAELIHEQFFAVVRGLYSEEEAQRYDDKTA